MSDRRSRVLDALHEAGGAPVSGEALAARLGISRTAVAKHVRALREAGYGIDAIAGTGYTLRFTPERPVAEEIARLTRSPLWVRIEGRDETASTNDDCRALAADGAPEGTVVIAARQTSGRGRMGRTWESPEGGAYLTVLLRPGLGVQEAIALPLVVALGVAMGLESLGARPRLKWPNDVWLATGKVAGVLLEMQAETDRVAWVCAGVGINVSPQDRAVPGAAYVADEVFPARASEVAACVLDGIGAAYARFGQAGFAALRREWEDRSMLADSDVVVRDMAGGAIASGRVTGLDDFGRLLLRTSEGERAVASGDVTLRVAGERADKSPGNRT